MLGRKIIGGVVLAGTCKPVTRVVFFLYFGLDEYSVSAVEEKLPKYRRFLYEIGGLDRGKGAVLDADVLAAESENDFEVSRVRRFRYRTKYFTDSAIIGSERYVRRIYKIVKHRLPLKREKVP